MKRILYIHNSADIYGASRSLLRLLAALDRGRFDPVVVLPAEGPLADRVRGLQVPLIIYSGLSVVDRATFRLVKLPWFLLRIPFSIAAIYSIIRRERIDLVHSNTGVILPGGPAAKCAGVPHVWHIRDWFQEFSGFWKYYEKFFRVFSDRILAVSEAIAAQFSSREKVAVVNNGFDLSEFPQGNTGMRSDFRKTLGISEEDIVAGVVGRIKWVRKGQEYVVRAIGILKTRGVKVWGLIVGTPFPGNEDHLVRLQDLARELGVEDQLIFTGELADPRPAYAGMDIFVLPSAQPEPFGGVVMEAMAMERPVVATRLGGSVDQVADGESGFLVEPANAEDLADKLEVLAKDAGLRGRMGRAGRERIATKFTLDGMVAQIEKLYEECLS